MSIQYIARVANYFMEEKLSFSHIRVDQAGGEQEH